MEFLKINQIRFTKSDLIFRESCVGRFVAVFGIAAIMAGAYYAYTMATIPKFIMLWIIFWMGLFLCMFLSALKKSFKSSNWLMAYNGERILVKFRSYLNNHFSDDDIQIFSIPCCEIQSVRKVKEVLKSRAMKGTDCYETFTYLEINAPQLSLTKLKRLLQDEKSKKVNGLRYGHNPVVISEANKVRLVWTNAHTKIMPNLNNTLKMLSKQIMIDEFAFENDKDANIEDLLRHGRTIDAVNLARRMYGYSTTEAKQYIESLEGLR